MKSIKITLRNIALVVVSALVMTACADTKKGVENAEGANEADVSRFVRVLTEEEKSEGWEYLFDGQNTSKWKSVNVDSFPSKGWAIEQGALVLASSDGGDIITREKFDSFELVFDFKLTDSANSGIKYFVGNMNNKDKEGKTIFNGPEYQIIDDHSHPAVTDDKKGQLTSTGALYLLYAPENKTLKPAGQWNAARIVANGKNVEHWLNGLKLLSYERGSVDFRDKITATKFKNQENYGELESGHIMITDHNDKVYFKNIKVRRL
jgi:hypothetical protein